MPPIIRTRAHLSHTKNRVVRSKIKTIVTRTPRVHRVYLTKLDEAGFKRALAESVFSSLLRDFPEETKIAFKEVFG